MIHREIPFTENSKNHFTFSSANSASFVCNIGNF